MISYEGKRFHGTKPGPDGTVATAIYHQDGDLVWALAHGGNVRHCVLAGISDSNGVITFGYSMVLHDGQIAIGRCRSTPEKLEDGRIRLREDWQRYAPAAATGSSIIEEEQPVMGGWEGPARSNISPLEGN